MTATTLSPSSDATEPSNDYHPYVRYGEPDGTQKPILHRVSDPVPDDAMTVSPIYQLDFGQVSLHRSRRENPYAFEGDKSLANILQNECEKQGRVLYPVYVESDANRGFPKMIESIVEFIERELEIPADKCSWYYTGSRSVHAHVPRFVTRERDLTELREMAIKYNENCSIPIDSQIYTSKRQFRIPGVAHGSGIGRKVEIDRDWDQHRILKESADAGPDPVPRTYANVLTQTIAEWPELSNQMVATRGKGEWELRLSTTNPEPTVESPLEEQQEYPLGAPTQVQNDWRLYNAQEFSPYAKVRGNSRSVASITVKGAPFARSEIRDGATLLPAYFHGGIGGSAEFTMDNQYSPLQLSKIDYQKRDWYKLTGMSFVLIGGGNGQSLIHQIDRTFAEEIGKRLSGKDGSRKAALELLDQEGFDIGSSGRAVNAGQTANRKVTRTAREMEQVLPATDPRTEAGKQQRRAEQEGIETLSHDDRFKVAARLLYKYRWEPVWRWFRKQYGDSFDPEVTTEQFIIVIEQYSKDYQHITVPST